MRPVLCVRLDGYKLVILYCLENLRERVGMSASTLNRHRWIGRVYLGVRENRGEGTRQNTPVTLE